MKKIEPSTISNQHLHQILLSSVAPRPIAFASTIDKNGNPNLSPFSFYNAFGVNPSTLIFSPSRRGRDNTTKHTYENLKEVPEVVLNAVTHSMVHQMSLSSTEYPKGVNEFEKAGFTQIDSEKILPFRIKESPLHFECLVREIIETGGEAGSANLVVCEIVMIHMDEQITDENGTIDPNKMDLVGRMGGNFYVRASGDAIFKVPKPLATLGIGIDNLPDNIRLSKYLSGNDLGQLGNIEHLPSEDEIERLKNEFADPELFTEEEKVHYYAKSLIESGKPYEALKLLMIKVSG